MRIVPIEDGIFCFFLPYYFPANMHVLMLSFRHWIPLVCNSSETRFLSFYVCVICLTN
jgi:hypothetical protein